MKQNAQIAVGVIGTALVIGIIKLAIQEAQSAGNRQEQSVEYLAAEIAKNHNAANVTDEMTVSSKAEARGKRVIISSVLRVQKDLPKEKLDQFRSELRAEILPKACVANAENVAFMRSGLSYTFVYFNTYGQQLAEITVDRAAYDKWKAAQSTSDNSNFWPVYRDTQAMFRISYPADWIVLPPKGRNTRFSVNPPNGPGNCNVVVLQNPELRGMTQDELNREIVQLPQDAAGWANYAGLPASNVRVIESRIAKIGTIPALLGVLEIEQENLEGRFYRYQIVAFTFKPGEIWSLNCGASSFSAEVAKQRFNSLRRRFDKVLGSFTFLQ